MILRDTTIDGVSNSAIEYGSLQVIVFEISLVIVRFLLFYIILMAATYKDTLVKSFFV